MDYRLEIQSSIANPQGVETLYRSAQKEGRQSEFLSAIENLFHEAPENVLLAAWHYRLVDEAFAPKRREFSPNWKLAVPIGVVTGLIFWLLSDTSLQFMDHIPHIILFWSPIATLLALVFLALTARRHIPRNLAAGVVLILASLYVLFITPGQGSGYFRHYLDLMAIHLPLLSWIMLGISLVGIRSNRNSRFAFLTKSIEVMITAGLYLIAGVAFGMITIGLFQALSIELPDILMRLIAAGGFGLIPVLAVASMYDPELEAEDQDFSQGLSKLIATMMRLLLPLTLLVLLVYIFVIPFNFMEPFRNRDLLIVYNVMLFAIMGLLIGVTPIKVEMLSPGLQRTLRAGIMAVAVLTILISLYALSATVFRTVQGGITINRTTIIGWNLINIAILVVLVIKQARNRGQGWVDDMRSVFSLGAVGYTIWAVFLIVAIPLLFR